MFKKIVIPSLISISVVAVLAMIVFSKPERGYSLSVSFPYKEVEATATITEFGVNIHG